MIIEDLLVNWFKLISQTLTFDHVMFSVVQRRRWGPSTLANLVDLLGSGSQVTHRNASMSRAYMLYQLFSLTASILAPSTVVLMTAGHC